MIDKDPLTNCMQQLQSRMTRGACDLRLVIQLIVLRSLKEILYEVNRTPRSQGVAVPDTTRRNRHHRHYPIRKKQQHRGHCDRCQMTRQPDIQPSLQPAVQSNAVPAASTSLDFIYADFKDGAGFQLVSVHDARFIGFYFYPYYKNGSNVRPVKHIRGKRINSWKDVREFRILGFALAKHNF